MTPTFNDKLIAYLVLLSGLAISGVAEYYSIMGLISIYPAAFWPIVIMGVVLGLGKVTGTIWLKQNWDYAPWFLKTYILPAIIILMVITSLGVFGYLSKAHSDQSLVSGDVQAKIAVYDEKIRTSKDNIDANRKALKQMDEAVDQVMMAQALDGEVFHYRDDYGIEVDAIVQMRDGRWGAIEVKLGQGQVEAAAAGLLRFRQQIDTRRTGEPAFLAVICGSGYGYRRADGIAVVPVGALGP